MGTDEELIFDVAYATIDHFWCTMLQQGWKFDKKTNLREYCFMIDSISKERFSITNIRKELFNMKQSQNENNLEFLEKINQIIQMADWQNISIIEATCLIFISGSICEDSKQICSKFMTKTPEGDVNKLREQLEVVMEVSKKVPEIENCTFCGKIGHKNDKCEAKCHLCASHNHFPGSCQGQAKSKKQKRRIEYQRRIKTKLMLQKSNLPNVNNSTEPLNHADTSTDQEDMTRSINDNDTVIDVEEYLDTTLDSQQGGAGGDSLDSQQGGADGDSLDSQQGGAEGDSFKKASEVINGVPLQQIHAAVESIKKAKYTDNTGLGLISQNLDFRNSNEETFLFYTGATASIMGEKMARENKIKIKNLSEHKSIHEASGAKLDIIGYANLFVKLESMKTPKKLTVFILRGNSVDREVLISVQLCKKWGIIHPTFPHETIKTYINRKSKIKKLKEKVSAIYERSNTPTKTKVESVDIKCEKLRLKILAKYSANFKDKLGKEDRVNIDPVKLHLKDANVKPVNVGKCFDVSHHLRKAAQKEFVEMVEAGILVPHDEPADWRSQSFPRAKPGSDPGKVRWVTDFRKLNACLEQPVWAHQSDS